MVLTGGFMGIEVVGGLVSGSLALLADAGHMLTDFAALGLAWFAFRIARRPPDQRRSYGYHRIQVLAAFVNGIVLVAVVGWILVEAVGRLLAPVEVLGGVMLAVAVGGLLVNIAAFALLHGGDRDNINLRAAAIHVLGDLLGSAAAILAAGVILGTGWMPIDPLLSVLVALLILRSSWLIIKKSAHILLEGTPDWLDVGRLRADLVAQVPGVEDVQSPCTRSSVPTATTRPAWPPSSRTSRTRWGSTTARCRSSWGPVRTHRRPPHSGRQYSGIRFRLRDGLGRFLDDLPVGFVGGLGRGQDLVFEGREGLGLGGPGERALEALRRRLLVEIPGHREAQEGLDLAHQAGRLDQPRG
jgi:cation diffusion facilitator family transporter